MQTRRDFIQATLVAGASLALTSACSRLRGPNGAAGSEALGELRAHLKGRVIVPGDPDYEEARRVAFWNPATDRHPAIVAQCESAADVARCVDFARRQEMRLAVRSGGHSFMGWGSGDGFVIDLSRMNEVSVDPVRRTIRVGAGVTAEAMVVAAAVHGLAPVLGECGSVGAGLGLGGGLGWLSGSYGATCDNLVSARLITAGADSMETDAESNSDLFWAIRGGGGNFGVVTSFEYRLHPLGEVLAGGFEYSADDARSVLGFFRDFMATAPDQLQALANLSSEKGGNLVVVFVYAGELPAGERVVDEFRKFRRPRRDWMQRRAYADTYQMPPYSDEGISCPIHAIRGTYLEHLSDAAMDTILGRFAEPPPACEIGFDIDHYMHGEVCRVARDATAFELRAPGALHVAFGASWDAPERSAACVGWLDETWKQMQRYSGGRMYANYMSAEGEAAAMAAYGGNFPRLVALKKKYDPNNVFRSNLNIRPS